MLSNRRTSKRLSQKKEVSEDSSESKKQRIDSNKSIYFDPSDSDDEGDDTDVFTTQKRQSGKKNVNKGSFKNKRQRVSSNKSIYFDKSGSEEDESGNICSSSKKDIKMKPDSTIKNDVSTSKYTNYHQNVNLSDSDSSSDEFRKAPISLDELGGFEVFKKENSVSESKLNGNVSVKMTETDDEEKPNNTEGYYDFSQIIKTQELITTMKSEFKEEVCNEAKPNTSKVSVEKLKKNTKRKNKISDIKKDNYSKKDEVSKLLAMAEGVDFEQSEKSDEDSEIKHDPGSSKGNVEVVIQLPQAQKKKKSKFDVEAAMKRRINLVRKENQVLIHKVHVLCWISHGNYLNGLLNNDELMGLALSLIPSQHCYPPKHTNLSYLEKVVEWFINKIPVDENKQQLLKYRKTTVSVLQEQISLKKVYSHRDLVLIFVCMLRSLGIHARLVISLRVVPLKPPASELFVVSTKPEAQNKTSSKSNSKNKTDSKKVTNTIKKDKFDKKNTKESKNKNNPSKNNDSKAIAKKRPKSDGTSSQYFSSSDEQPLINKVKLNTPTKSKYFKTSEEKDLNKSEVNRASTTGDTSTSSTVNIKRFSREKKIISKTYTKQSSSEDEMLSNKKVIKTKNVNSKTESKSSLNKKRSNSAKNADDDFKPSPLKKQTRSKQDIDRRVLSSDEDGNDKKKIGVDYWAEVFLEEEEKFISVDLTRGRVHCVHKIYNLATSPVRYVLAWNNDKTIKDITRRYTPQWMTVTRKQRVDQDWWEETIAPYLPHSTAREREEDEDLDRQLQDQPLPKSVSEYKNHPLYALRRHLLKFQGIYPPDPPPVGFIRGEPVYSRSCIVELHTRETWIKDAKCVKLGEEPYKVVKARPKYDKLTGNVINNLPLPLFGHWQVEDYIPPPAVDGKVPRNEYGNVELYKPCMLPAGTVHLQLPSVNRVARKLNIDCAPAVVGWEFHCGGSHPILDGFIVCEEFKDVLLDAWNKEIDESARRAKEKVEQRVYGNWKRLIKGLLIRERLKHRYDFGPVPSDTQKSKKKPTHRHRKST